jgi:hypothetical protein
MAKTSYISIIISKKNNANFSCIMAKTSYILHNFREYKGRPS